MSSGTRQIFSLGGANAWSGTQTMSGHILFSPDTTYNIGANGANRPANIYTENLIVGSTILSGPGPQIKFGTGSPEGQITAPPGSIYLRSDPATDAALYTKNSGVGNTGWVAIDNV